MFLKGNVGENALEKTRNRPKRKGVLFLYNVLIMKPRHFFVKDEFCEDKIITLQLVEIIQALIIKRITKQLEEINCNRISRHGIDYR